MIKDAVEKQKQRQYTYKGGGPSGHSETQD